MLYICIKIKIFSQKKLKNESLAIYYITLSYYRQEIGKNTYMTHNNRDPLPSGNSGLINVGNTCYLNTAIQLLSHTDIVRRLLRDTNVLLITILRNAKKILCNIVKTDENNELLDRLMQKVNSKDYATKFQDIFSNDEKTYIFNNSLTFQTLRLVKCMWTKNVIVNPILFRNKFSELRGSFFKDKNQHDAEEAYSCIIEMIHEELSISQPGAKLRARNTFNLSDPDLIIDPLSSKESNQRYIRVIKTAFNEIEKFYEKSHSKIIDIFSGFFHSSITCPNPRCEYSCDNFNSFFHIPLIIPHEKSEYTLDECIKSFCKEEILDNNNLWKCNGCSENVAAKKRMMLWSAPPILVFQISRFLTGIRDKDKRFVKYPLTNLDISEMISPVSKMINNNKCYKYELYGVINHIDAGTINFGHYYAYCVDEDTNEWYKYDDDNPIVKITPSKVVTANAYMLFYVRRDRLVVPKK